MFQVIVGNGGFSGWKLLNSTADIQKTAIANEGAVRQQKAYFVNNIKKVTTADDLVSDYRLLSVALRAYGLDDDINSKHFIRQVLSSDLSDNKSLVNKLTDKRYLQLAEAFQLGGAAPAPATDLGFGQKITDLYVDREFERRVGQVDNNMRLALNARREIGQIVSSDASEETKWYRILGSPPLKSVLEGAFGYNSNFGKLPIDRQVTELKAKAKTMFGSSEATALNDPKNQEKLLQQFLIRADANATVQNRFSPALTILGNSNLLRAARW